MASKDNVNAREFIPKNVPSIIELKKALPEHCFKPTLQESLYYVGKDLTALISLYIAQTYVEASFPLLSYITTPIYWYLQGTIFTAIFVLGHDCGHESFSNHTIVNDILGNIFHGFLMVPYYPWKLSHRHHHKNTGNIDKDEIFYPVREKDHGSKRELPPFFLFGAAWYLYLAKGYAPREINHFNPLDPVLSKHIIQCSISLACLVSMVSFVLIPYSQAFGFMALASHYLVPLSIYSMYLLMITFLHHQDENVPWYADQEWDFVKGNLSSIDRNYGWAHGVIHNIGTHQIHHLFSKVPHYHLEEATRVFREKFPHLVRKSDEPILPQFFKMFKMFNEQQWIGNDTDIHILSSKKKL